MKRVRNFAPLTVLTLVGLAACSGSASTDPSPVATKPTGNQVESLKGIAVPASQQTKETLGVHSWLFATGKIHAIVGRDASEEEILRATIVESETTSMVHINTDRGELVLDMAKGTIQSITDSRIVALAAQSNADYKAYIKAGGLIPYDACSDATFTYYVALAAEAATCATAPVTGVGLFACLAAAAAAAAAASSMNTACAPQLCVADYQCSDKYGAGYHCQSGACVYSSISYCGDGTCNSGENCSLCPQDCGCSFGTVCNLGVCQAGCQLTTTCGTDSCGVYHECSGGYTCNSYGYCESVCVAGPGECVDSCGHAANEYQDCVFSPLGETGRCINGSCITGT